MSLFPAFIIKAAGGTDLHFGFWKINSTIKISVPEWWKQLRQGETPLSSLKAFGTLPAYPLHEEPPCRPGSRGKSGRKTWF